MQRELAELHREGWSDYSLARLFGVSTASINKARLHAQVGARVIAAINPTMGWTLASLIARNPGTTHPGCNGCESRKGRRVVGRDGVVLVELTLCDHHNRRARWACFGTATPVLRDS